jgi:hypothetical protein
MKHDGGHSHVPGHDKNDIHHEADCICCILSYNMDPKVIYAFKISSSSAMYSYIDKAVEDPSPSRFWRIGISQLIAKKPYTARMSNYSRRQKPAFYDGACESMGSECKQKIREFSSCFG